MGLIQSQCSSAFVMNASGLCSNNTLNYGEHNMTKLPIKWSEMSKTLNQQKKTEVKFEVPSCDPKREIICNLSQTAENRYTFLVHKSGKNWYTFEDHGQFNQLKYNSFMFIVVPGRSEARSGKVSIISDLFLHHAEKRSQKRSSIVYRSAPFFRSTPVIYQKLILSD